MDRDTRTDLDPLGTHGSRDVLPDLLRGLALLGIVVVNAPYLGSSTLGFSPEAVASTLDEAAAFLVIALAQGKFFLLFSFLFGYSLAYVLRDDRPDGRARFRRRLLVLAAFGIAHAVLLFAGDILLTYAVLGVVLLRLARSAHRTVLRAARLAFVVGTLLLTAGLGLQAAFPQEVAAVDPATVAFDAGIAGATVGEAIGLRAAVLPTVLGTVALAQGPYALAAFLLGLLASRRRLLADPAAHAARWRRLIRIGLGAGLPLQLVAAVLQVAAIRAGIPTGTAGSLGLLLGFVTAPLLTAGYVGLVAAAVARRPDLLRRVRPAGRMSLTVYLGQSLLLVLVFGGLGIGPGLFGQLGTAAVVLIGVATWLVLTALSAWWLRSHDRGPLEAIVARLSTPRGRRP
ncbi:MAG: hypothetical protein RLZZ272_902 [Actinomycetota bacterium]|jgi:uncharacterized protein